MVVTKHHLGTVPTPPSNVLALLQSAATKYSIPPDLLVAQAAQESGFNQAAVSSKGAIGIMQLMPTTAADLGVDPNNLSQNIDGGAKYLAQQYARFGSWDLALAAYNAGGGTVHAAGGIPNIPETQNYVTSITALRNQYAAMLGVVPPTADASLMTPPPAVGTSIDTGTDQQLTDILGQTVDPGTTEAGITTGLGIGTLALIGLGGWLLIKIFSRS